MRTIHTPFGSVPLPAHSQLLEDMAAGKYAGIGFDLDHTLLRYHLPVLLEHIYNAQVRYLVEVEKFPAALGDVPWSRVSRFAGKGTVMDIDTGHLLKINADGDVTRCYDSMGNPVRPSEFGNAVQLHFGELLPDGATGAALVAGYDRDRFVFTRSERFTELPSYFDVPLASLWVACHISGCESSAEVTADPPTVGARRRALYASFIRGFIFNYTGENGEIPTKGFFFPAIVADPARFLVPWTETEKKWLAGLSERGTNGGSDRPLCAPFVVSNALAGFVDFALDFVCGGSRVWRDWFAVVVGEAAKPAFFDAGSLVSAHGQARDPTAGALSAPDPPPLPERPFTVLGKDCSEQRHEITLWEHVTLRGGCAAPIARALASMDSSSSSSNSSTSTSTAATTTSAVIYVGDHLRNDVFACKHALGWACIAVVEEVAMEHMMDTKVPEIGTPQWDYGSAWGSAFLAEHAEETEAEARSFRAGARTEDRVKLSMATGLMVQWADLVVPSVQDLAHEFNATVETAAEEDQQAE